MEFIYKLFPKEGMFADISLEIALGMLGCLICGFIAYWLAKAVLCWLFKKLSHYFRLQSTCRSQVLATLTARTIKRKYQIPTFDALEFKDSIRDENAGMRRRFETYSYITPVTSSSSVDYIADYIVDEN